jgi:hypothetical protein
MSHDFSQPDMQRRIASLLETAWAGNAVARELDDLYSDWQTRAVIADLRRRKAQARHDRTVDALQSASVDASGPRH